MFASSESSSAAENGDGKYSWGVTDGSRQVIVGIQGRHRLRSVCGEAFSMVLIVRIICVELTVNGHGDAFLCNLLHGSGRVFPAYHITGTWPIRECLAEQAADVLADAACERIREEGMHCRIPCD